ncbi:MAG: type II secretion system F family protein, partial [Phycisphaerae bacterium]
MPRFAYRSAGGGGGGVIEAPDRATALREVMRRGEVPASMEELAGGGRNGSVEHGTSLSATAQKGGVSLEIGSVMSLPELAYFMRELSTALRAGLPLIQALKTIAKQGRKQRQKAMLASIIDQVEHGKSLSDAFATQGPPFTELVINLTRAGEASGKLGEVLAHAADLLDKDVKLRRSLMAATLYPGIIAVLVVGAVIVVTTFIVPS